MKERLQDFRETYDVEGPEDLAVELEPGDRGWGDVARWRATRQNLAIAKAALQVDEAHRLADAGRFDVTWTDRGYYRYHDTEGDEFNYRYDRHPRPDLPDDHFHAPPDAAHDAVPSCIEVTTVRLVTLAVLQLWRETVETGELDALQGRNPP